MSEDWLFAVRAFAAILVIVDPLGNVPFFVAATSVLEPAQHHRVAWRAAAVAGVVLLGVAVCGSGLLRMFHVTFPAVRIGGGIVVLIIALRILSGRQFGWEDDRSLGGDVGLRTSVVPLAIPLMAGPGAMTTVLVLVAEARGGGRIAAVLASILVVCALGGVCYRFATSLVHRLGRTAIVTLSCLAGLILAVIAVQFMLDGLREALPRLFP
jgi:multiple antibiotic resistance protein